MWVMDSRGVPLRSVMLSVTVTVSEKDMFRFLDPPAVLCDIEMLSRMLSVGRLGFARSLTLIRSMTRDRPVPAASTERGGDSDPVHHRDPQRVHVVLDRVLNRDAVPNQSAMWLLSGAAVAVTVAAETIVCRLLLSRSPEGVPQLIDVVTPIRTTLFRPEAGLPNGDAVGHIVTR